MEIDVSAPFARPNLPCVERIGRNPIDCLVLLPKVLDQESHAACLTRHSLKSLRSGKI